MTDLLEPTNYSALVDTGVSIQIRLDTQPILVTEARTLVSFLDEVIQAQLEICEQLYGDHGIVAVIELESGSLKAKVRLLARGAGAAAKEVAKAIVVAWGIFGLQQLGVPATPVGYDATPPQCISVIEDHAHDLMQRLNESGKPYKIFISCGQVIIEANQPNTFSPESGSFDL